MFLLYLSCCFHPRCNCHRWKGVVILLLWGRQLLARLSLLFSLSSSLFLLFAPLPFPLVGSTNFTTHAVVFSQQQTSQHHHQHQPQTSNNDKRHRVFFIRTTNVTMSQCSELWCRTTYKLWCYLSLRHYFLLLNILQYNLHVNSKYIHRQ